mgnify:CR=1 FL=1|tara:strand:+ start:807 stop:1697 length:891 start_codon:yes stop_codon:yes gene_type:complete
MTIDTEKNAKLLSWHQCLANLFSIDPGPRIMTELLKGLESLVDGNSSMVIIYPKGSAPVVTHHRLLANETLATQAGNYINGAYLLDPFYLKAVNNKTEGIFSLAEVAPDAFEQSEYFNFYYNESNLTDEACFIFQREDQSITSISIGRAATFTSPHFTDEEIGRLKSVYPLVRQIANQNLDLNLDNNETLAPVSLERCLDNALEKFGTSVLTPRECQVLHLILMGHSIKWIAEHLENSLETIKSHRKNIYTKLDVSSQAELFYLFIASLRHTSNSSTEDPLISFTSPRITEGQAND